MTDTVSFGYEDVAPDEKTASRRRGLRQRRLQL